MQWHTLNFFKLRENSGLYDGHVFYLTYLMLYILSGPTSKGSTGCFFCEAGVNNLPVVVSFFIFIIKNFHQKEKKKIMQNILFFNTIFNSVV